MIHIFLGYIFFTALGYSCLYSIYRILCLIWIWHLTGKQTSPKKVSIIITRNNGGQLGNQLKNFAHIYAYCLEKNYDLFNPSFRPDYAYGLEHFRQNASLHVQQTTKDSLLYCKLWHKTQKYIARFFFSNLPILTKINASNNAIILIPPQKEGAWQALSPQKCTYYVNEEKFDNNIPLFMEELNPGRYCFEGWAFRTDLGLKKYHKEIIELFRPHTEYQKNINAFWQTIDSTCLTIGIHIRQGDYRYWHEGKHYFETTEYLKKMLELQKIYQAFNPFFIIFSNESHSKTQFQGFDCLIAQGNPIEDLYSMARCDIILGPYSTYNEWATYYGNSLLIPIEDFSNVISQEFNRKVHDRMSSKNRCFP